MKYIVGIDSGGTKTIVDIYTVYLKHVDSIFFGPGNIHDIKKSGYLNLLDQIKEKINYYDVCFITYGCPGYGENKADTEFINLEFKKRFNNMKYKIVNDIDVACMGALDFQDGINIIAGTGSLAQLNYRGVSKRVGGWGSLIGDEGSAYFIGQKAIKEFCHQSDGRHHKTILYKLLKDHYEIDDDMDIITKIYGEINSRNVIASASQVVDLGASNGCEVCCYILEIAAKELAKHIKYLLKDIEDKVLVSYTGSVFKSSMLLEKFRDELKNEKCTIVAPINEPVYGAVLSSYKEIKNVSRW